MYQFDNYHTYKFQIFKLIHFQIILYPFPLSAVVASLCGKYLQHGQASSFQSLPAHGKY
jgi:hypothetical protein